MINAEAYDYMTDMDDSDLANEMALAEIEAELAKELE